MIQRIQTVYLLIATILMGLTLALPLATIMSGAQLADLMAFGIRSVGPDGSARYIPSVNYMSILLCLGALMPLVAVFFFKFRTAQIRICYGALVVTAGAQAMVAYYLWAARESVASLSDKDFLTLSVPDIFPLLAFFFICLALRGIRKDEALVRSLDRIR